MLRVDVHQARPGMPLALPVMHPEVRGQILLRRGFVLNDSSISRLRTMRVADCWVQYPSLASLEKFIDVKRLENQAAVVQQITAAFEATQGQSSPKLRYDVYVKTIENLIQGLMEHPHAAVYMGDLLGLDDALLRRSACVTYLSIMMGLKLGGYLVRERHRVAPDRAKDVTNLGVGAMLHDIGITLLEPEVLKRHRETGDDSDPEWQQHPAKGYEAVRGTIEPTAAAVVLNHHQRFDGKGYVGGDYPNRAGHGIHIFARIAAVAQTFDALCQPDQGPVPPRVWVLGSMLSAPACDRFDPEALRGLAQVAPPYPPGTRVTLSDGRQGVVMDHVPTDPCRPVVQPLPPTEDLDLETPPAEPAITLAEHHVGLFIAEAEGHDVSDLNFGPDKLPGSWVNAA